jgi:succinyl-CoA synthetase beta subunit
MRDLSEQDMDENEARSYGLNFIKLRGTVGCMVNGAGLAMATMDFVKMAGGDPANFLDVAASRRPKRSRTASESLRDRSRSARSS